MNQKVMMKINIAKKAMGVRLCGCMYADIP